MSLHSAYILHRYPYRETSFLLKIFTKTEGLITVVARNAKRPKSDWYTLLQPFQKIGIAYQGKGSVLTLTHTERENPALVFDQKALFAGFYLNELLLKFLAPHDIHALLFNIYDETLTVLNKHPESLEETLRHFELMLFEEIGLLPDFQYDQAGEAIEPEAWYQLEYHHQPRKLDAVSTPLPYHFQGMELIHLRKRAFHDTASLKSAKRFTRLWLEFYGAGRNLHTREIFAEVFKGG